MSGARKSARECRPIVRVNTNQFRSAEQRLARWVTYGVLAAPLVAILSRSLGIGAITPWIVYASIAGPMIVMLSHRETDVDPLIRWLLYVIIALTPILPARLS
jgi:hypothetical protein